MDMRGYLDHLNAGRTVVGGSEEHRLMHAMSQEAIRICMEINNCYHTPEELRALMAELIGAMWTRVSRSFRRSTATVAGTSTSGAMCSSMRVVSFKIRAAFIWVTACSWGRTWCWPR